MAWEIFVISPFNSNDEYQMRDVFQKLNKIVILEFILVIYEAVS